LIDISLENDKEFDLADMEKDKGGYDSSLMTDHHIDHKQQESHNLLDGLGINTPIENLEDMQCSHDLLGLKLDSSPPTETIGLGKGSGSSKGG